MWGTATAKVNAGDVLHPFLSPDSRLPPNLRKQANETTEINADYLYRIYLLAKQRLREDPQKSPWRSLQARMNAAARARS